MYPCMEKLERFSLSFFHLCGRYNQVWHCTVIYSSSDYFLPSHRNFIWINVFFNIFLTSSIKVICQYPMNNGDVSAQTIISCKILLFTFPLRKRFCFLQTFTDVFKASLSNIYSMMLINNTVILL